MIGNYEYLYNK